MKGSGNVGKPGVKTGSIAPIKPSAQPTAAKPSGAPVSGKKPSLTVSTNSKNKDHAGIDTLLGDYEEVGTNHGKKYFKKVQAIAGHEDVDVYLYYWDNRDGADFSGYWFGDELGGSQVWARCNSHGNVPPVAGWKFPWDAMKAEPGLLTVSPYKGSNISTPQKPISKPEIAKPAAVGGKGNNSNGSDEKVKKLTEEIDTMDAAAKEIVTHAKSLKEDADSDALNETVESLQQHQNQLNDAQKTLQQEITEARKGGPAGQPKVVELSKRVQKLRIAMSSVSSELTRLKGFVSTAAKKEEQAKKLAANQAQNKELEEKHQQELDETLPIVQDTVDAAEDAVEAVGIMASPIMTDPPDDAGDSLKHILEEIETAATDAQNKLTEARQSINSKLQVARNFAPEVRKKALADFTAMQQKLADAQKKLTPYKNFKREFAQRVEAKKAVQEIAEKLGEVELEVEKAAMISAGAEGGSQMSEEDVNSAEGLVKPAQTGLASVGAMIESKLRGATGPMKDELTDLKTRLTEFKANLEKVNTILKTQREGVTLQTIYATVNEKVEKAEAAFEKCGDAELIFLKGIEVLPKDESEQAIKDSEAAIAETIKEANQAKNFLKTKQIEVKRFSKASQEAGAQELADMQKKLDELDKKIESFKNETADRKVTSMMSEAVDGVVKSEAKCKLLVEAAKIFESESFEGINPAMLKEASEKTAKLDKECAAAVAHARSVVSAKQKDSKDKEMSAALTKLTSRINTVQQEATKSKRAASIGDKLAKCMEVVTEGDTKLTEVEAEVDQLVRMSKPEDEGLGVERITDEAVLKLDVMSAATAKSLKTVTALVAANLSTAPPAIKTSLSKLSDRCKAAQTKVDQVKVGTKEQRERVLSESYVKEADAKTKEVEATLEKAGEAEAPYLKGMEVLPLEEARSSLAACEEVATKVQDAISAARDFIATKNLEVKRFESKSAKPSIDEFAKLTERVNAGAQKLGLFKKDMELRKKKAMVQEGIAKVTEVETEVEKVKEAMTSYSEKDPDAMSIEEAAALVKTAEALDKSVQSKIVECGKSLRDRMRDAKSDADKVSQIKELENRLAAAKNELNKAKRLGSTNNEKIQAKALVQEVADKLKDAEASVEKAQSSCAPLLEEKCEPFLVKNSLRTLSTALLAHMDEKSLSEDDIHKMMGLPLNQVNFVEFVGKVPETLQREECSFTEERRIAMFKSADADKDELISIDELKLMFSRRYVCMQSISMTDVADIKDSTTKCKLEKGDVVQALGAPKAAAEDGIKRMRCKLLSSGEEGWVTVQSNTGKEYMEVVSPFKTFTTELLTELDSMNLENNKVLNFFIQKYKEYAVVGKDSHPHLVTTKDTLSDAKAKMSKLLSGFDKLRKDVDEAIKGYAALETKENNAHIEAKERKEAESILSVARPFITAFEAAVAKLDDASKPLVERRDTDLLPAFATPLTVLDDSTKLAEVVKTAAEEAKKIVIQQKECCQKIVKGPLLEAKKQLNVWTQDVVRSTVACNKKVELVQKCCDTIATAKLQFVASAMRSSMKAKGVSLEAHFSELSAGADRISEDSFCSYVQGLDGVELPAEHAKLLVRQIEANGIGRRAFLRLLQQYFKVVQGIALTPEFSIDSKEKPIRKAEVDEILELLEGPTTEEKSGLARVRVRAINDGAEGWISLKGNQGKVYLEKVEKPFLNCLKEVAVDGSFEVGAGEPVATLKAQEVIELIEGPRKEATGTTTRLRAKVAKDGKSGWVTLKDKQGNEFVEKSSKCYTCTASVAITDAFDIKACKVVRKLAVDEVFTIEEGPIVHEESGISRAKGKCGKDGIEGWVTISGNAGTVYAKLNEKLYVVTKEVKLTEQFSSTSKEIRTLAVDEAFEAVEGPKDEKLPAVERAKIRTSKDVVGWVTVKSGIVARWSPNYRFTEDGSLYGGKGLKEVVVREAEKGEKAELLDGPVEVDGEMWMKCSMKKDGAVGWVPMKDKANLTS